MKKHFGSSKGNKRIIAFITTTITAFSLFSFNVFAHYYDNLPSEIFEHLIKRTWYKDVGRMIIWSILRCLARIIDYFEKAVDAIVNFNMYKLFERITGFSNLNPIIPMVFSIFMILGACAMMIFPNKIKVKDYLRGILVSAALIIALPVFISSMDEMKSAGIKDVDNMKTSSSNSSGIKYGVGDEILQNFVIDVEQSRRTLKYYSDNSPGNVAEQVYYLNINDVIGWSKGSSSSEDDPSFRWAIKSSSIASDGQNRYEELTYENRAALLGLGAQYQQLVNMRNTLKPDETVPIGINYYEKKQYTTREYEFYLIQILCQNKDIQNGAYPEDKYIFTGGWAGTFKTFEEALKNRSVEKVLRDLNWQENKKIVSQNSGLAAKKQSYSYEALLSEKEYEDLSIAKTVGQLVEVGSGQEYLYRYDVDFFATLIFLICVAVSMLLVGLRLGTLIFDIIFTQLIAPIVISTSITAPDRAKRVFKNLLSSYLLFVIVFMLMKIYIWSVIYIRDTVNNYAAQIILIVSFAKVVISTPAFLTKLLGVDSGPLSAIGTIMALSSASNMLSQTGRLVKGTAGRVLNRTVGVASTGTHGAGKVGGTVIGAVAGGHAGFHEGREEGGRGAAVRGALLGTVTGGYAAARNDRATTGQSARQVGRDAGIRHARSSYSENDVPNVPPEQQTSNSVTPPSESSFSSEEPIRTAENIDSPASSENTTHTVSDNSSSTPASPADPSAPAAPRGSLLDSESIDEGYAQKQLREKRTHGTILKDNTNDKK